MRCFRCHRKIATFIFKIIENNIIVPDDFKQSYTFGIDSSSEMYDLSLVDRKNNLVGIWRKQINGNVVFDVVDCPRILSRTIEAENVGVNLINNEEKLSCIIDSIDCIVEMEGLECDYEKG